MGILCLSLFGAPVRIHGAAWPSSQLAVLQRGQPIERDLSGGQAHSYQVELADGSFVFVAVEQKGIDVVVRMFDPAGKLLSEVDSPNGSAGEEPVKLITETGGSFRVEVSSLENNAPLGRYEIKLVEVRPAVQRDRDLFAARRLYDEARELTRQLSRASLTASLGKYEEALALYRRAEDTPMQVDLLINYSGANRLLGNLETALKLGGQALKLAENLGDKNRQARVFTLAAGIYRNLGDYDQALRATDRAHQLFDEVGDRANTADSVRAVGEVYSFLGEQEKARDYYEQAIALYRGLGNKNGEATTLRSNGYSYIVQYNSPQALENFRRALAIWQQVGNQTEEAIDRSFIGLEYARAASQTEATENLTEAVRLRPTVGNFDEGTILTNVAHAYALLHDYEKSATYFTDALRIWRAIGDRRGEAIALKHYAASLRDQGRLADARAQADQAIALLELMRDHAGSPEMQAAFVSGLFDFYAFYVDLLMRLHDAQPGAGYDLTALAFSEKIKLRSLRELLASGHVELMAGADAELLDRERRINDKLTDALDQMARLIRGKHTEEQRVAAETQLTAMQEERRQVLEELRRRSPRYSALVQPEPLSPNEIRQQLLAPNSILFEYSLGDERSYLWAITSEGVQSYRLPSQSEIEKLTTKVYQQLSARRTGGANAAARSGSTAAANDQTYWTDAGRLSDILLGPVAAQLGSKRLLIVADGALQYLPFSVLPPPGTTGVNQASPPKPLIVEHEIVNLPSASVIAVMRNELAGRPAAPNVVAVMADPVYQMADPRVRTRGRSSIARTTVGANHPAGTVTSDLPVPGTGSRSGTELSRLLFSRDEADAIISVTPPRKGMLALDFQANRRLAMSEDLSQYRILHFSSHGFLDSRHPELSGLVLSLVDETGKPQEGYLRLHEIYNLRLNADLVVLSACQTALGKDVRGEGLIGLTRGFMYAGVPRLVASLWEVDDAATTELMKRFYRGMLQNGLSPAAALRVAQIEMLSKPHWRSPYYWGAFVLQGEWK